MYIDSLTITALIILIAALVMFVKACVLGYCGSACNDGEDCKPRTWHYKR